jgi:hypothetical protein
MWGAVWQSDSGYIIIIRGIFVVAIVVLFSIAIAVYARRVVLASDM